MSEHELLPTPCETKPLHMSMSVSRKNMYRFFCLSMPDFLVSEPCPTTRLCGANYQEHKRQK